MAENSNKELAPMNLPTRIDAQQWGITMEPEDVVMPRLSLLQPTSEHEGAGKFLFTLTGELFDKIECVVFSNARGRVMFDPDQSKRMSICGSDGRIEPLPRYENPPARECIKCPFSNRNYAEKVIVGGKEVNKFCSETQTLRAMFVDSLFPFIFVGRRSSILPVNNWLSIMQFETVKNKKPLVFFPIRITSKLGKGANKYFVPVIEQLGMIEREEFIAMMNKYGNYDINKTYEAEEKMGKGVPSDEDGVPF